MNTQQVQDVMDRVPDRQHAYESGKRWIPFYYGNDARRMQVLYKGEGCLIITDSNSWGGAGGDLVQIEVDPSGPATSRDLPTGARLYGAHRKRSQRTFPANRQMVQG